MPKQGTTVADFVEMAHAFDRLDDHVILTDEHSVILYANQAAERATGFTIDEMLGHTPGQLWGGHMNDEFYENLWRTILKDKQTFRGEVHNRMKSGEFYWQELIIYPLFNQAGGVEAFIGVEPVITERKKVEEETRGKLAELERMDRLLVEREKRVKQLKDVIENMRGNVRNVGNDAI